MAEKTGTVTHMEDLLIELGCEELPPKALDGLRESLLRAVCLGLEKHHLTFDPEQSRGYSTPRRLAVLISNVSSRQPDLEQDRRGPAVKAAFDEEGNPSRAAIGFARSVGKEVSELETVSNEKGEWLFFRVRQPGKPLSDLIFPILEQALAQLPVPRPMRWSDNEFSFIRPVHWLVVMHGDRILEGRLLGLDASNRTRGHRIHAPGPLKIASGSEYLQTLEQAFVLADQEQRKTRIRDLLLEEEPDVLIDGALLDEVKNLVEWPVAVSCSFEKEFLEVPHAALIASMQDHQKFFPVLNRAQSGQVTNRFVAISNLESMNTEAVREGYERVIRPRLADARFFLEQDQKQPLDGYLALLDRVVFQKDIGTIGDKSRRLVNISQKIAEDLAFQSEPAMRAALLAKCDLMTQMVGEFPELQGVMGRIYAQTSGEADAVAEAIGEHYSPRFAGDEIPRSETGRIVSIADRLDTLVGIFAAGQRPSGKKDPFALRRSALGLVRILLEAELELPLNQLLATTANELADQITVEPGLLVDLREFVIDRLRHYYREQGYGTELINAVFASGWDTLPDLDRRLRALDTFMGQSAASSLAAANKRIGNILAKSKVDISSNIDNKLLLIDEEKRLFEEIKILEKTVSPLLENGEYDAGLEKLASLREPVDAFFDSVMVMDEDEVLRNNRLSLLARLKSLFDRIADLSILG